MKKKDVPSRRAVFLDRDGVISVPEFRDGRSYAPKSLSEFRLYPDAVECLRELSEAGFVLIVVTNQPDVGNGLVMREVVEAMHDEMRGKLPVERVECCYHRQNEDCRCRKPKPGMLVKAADEMNIDLESSYMVGDRWSDIEAGKTAGCSTIFIDHGYRERNPQEPDAVVASLREATDYILGFGLSAHLRMKGKLTKGRQ